MAQRRSLTCSELEGQMNLAFLNLKAEQRSWKLDTSRPVIYLLSRWKRRLRAQRMQWYPLSTPLGLHCHQRVSTSRSIQQIIPPFRGASYWRWLGIYPFSDIQRLFCEPCRKTKGLQRGERQGTKGTGLHVVSDTCSHFVSWSVAEWEPKFCLYNDMVPKSSHLHSYWTQLWTT